MFAYFKFSTVYLRGDGLGSITGLMSDIIDLTQEDPSEIIYISDDEPRLDGPEGDPLAARTDAECDPTIKRDGEYPAILVGPCEFINKEGWRERTAPAYLKFTEHSGTAVFAGCHIRKGEPVFIYGGSLVDLEPCSRNNLPSDRPRTS